jgi:hypothetical protein
VGTEQKHGVVARYRMAEAVRCPGLTGSRALSAGSVSKNIDGSLPEHERFKNVGFERRLTRLMFQRLMGSVTMNGACDSALRVQDDDGGRVFLDPPAS